MGEEKKIRLSKAAREFNVGIATIIEFLHKKGYEEDLTPNSKISSEIYEILAKEYSSEVKVKKESEKVRLHVKETREAVSIKDVTDGKKAGSEEEEELIIKDAGVSTPHKTAVEEPVIEEPKGPKVVGKIDLETKEPKKSQKKSAEKKKEPEPAEEKKEAAEKKEELPETETKKAAPEKTEKEAPAAEKEAEKEEKKEKTPAAPPEEEVFKSEVTPLSGLTVVGKIELPKEEPKKKPVATSRSPVERKKKRKRIRKDKEKVNLKDNKSNEDRKARKGKRYPHHEVDEEDVQKQIKETLARLTAKNKPKAAKYRREKRQAIIQKQIADNEEIEKGKKTLKVTEFVSVSELAAMMDVPATDVISTCMSLGLIVSINQRLDAETMALVADEFGYDVEFVSADILDDVEEEDQDREEDLVPRPPIVTVMGHVDHGKTKLLDYIRNTNIIAGEAGGITQHIGAYAVTLPKGEKITFLDTPGHEAFTAMRARGAQITDIAVIVVAADDGVMPQTVEAINHAQAAGVPIIFAINKIDKPTANAEKIKEELANMNILVEDWGGKYQSQEISAKQGKGVKELLEKILLEAELLELKANPNKPATGTIIESSLDKGRGYVATILVKNGTLKIGDIMLAGSYYGHIKAMFDERNKKLDSAGPAMPALILGLNGAPQAGDKFNVMSNEREARNIALKRQQLQREQSLRTQKHITLEEIGRRIAIGNFQELNIVVKGDVDGSVEALSDALIKLSTEEIQVNIIHKAVGQISESDVLLAAASDAIIIGFQVRPSTNARKLAEKEEVDIRLYSIIYDAIEDIKSAMEGMLQPKIKEDITGTLEVKETFKITKVGTIAGCIVTEGKIFRNSRVRIIRDGIVIYTGELASLKRFKEDVKEVVSGQECGLNIQNFNDLKVGDIIEAFEEIEVKQTL